MALVKQKTRSLPSQRANLYDFPFDTHYGVYRAGDRLSCPPDFFWTLQNCYVGKDNWVEQRNGSTRITTAPLTGSPKIRKLFEVQNKTYGRTTICRGGTRWARLTGTTWTDLATGRPSDAYGQICQFNNEVIMCDGGAPLVSTMAWSVSTLSGPGIPTKSSCCHTHNHRIILNDDDNPMAFACSKVDSKDFDTTGTSDAINIDLSKVLPIGDRIVGFSTYLQTFLVVWLQKSIVIYNLPTTFADISLQQVIFNTGCLSYEGVYQVDKDLWFPHDSGYTALSMVIGNPQIIDVNDVTRNINRYFREAILQLTDTRDICAIYQHSRDFFYFTIPFSTGYETWVISTELQAVSGGKGNIAGGPFTGIQPCSFLFNLDEDLFYGGDDGHLYQMDIGTNDNGSPITFLAEKTGLYFGNPKLFKAPREFESLIQASLSLNATISYNYETGNQTSNNITSPMSVVTVTSPWDTSLWDVSYWDTVGSALFKSRNLLGRGKVMNFSITHNTLDAQLRFRNWIISVSLQGDK